MCMIHDKYNAIQIATSNISIISTGKEGKFVSGREVGETFICLLFSCSMSFNRKQTSRNESESCARSSFKEEGEKLHRNVYDV